MKKKKLKKKIKKLKEACKLFMNQCNQYGEGIEDVRRRIHTLGDKYTEFRKDFRNLEQKINSKADATGFEINDIYEKLKILKLRTETDYTQFKPFVDTSKGPYTEESNEKEEVKEED